MNPTKKHLTLRISKLKEAIRRKYNSFKTGVAETETFYEKKYKPIVSVIKKVNNVSTKELLNPKKEEKYSDNEDDDEVKTEDLGQDLYDYEPEPFSTPSKHAIGATDLDSMLSTPVGRDSITKFIDIHFKSELTRKYMDMFMKDRGGRNAKIDHLYGPRYEDDILMVGNRKLDFNDEGSIILNNVQFRGTEGLYELLFKRIPDEDLYSEDDLLAYKDLLTKSNAHKKGYTEDGLINRNQSLKYKTIISKLFPLSNLPRKKGSGMQWKTTASRDIVHWDDPNELVDRLRLLAMSAETGNTSHTNEILNIIEELREGNFIKGVGNNRFKALLK